MTGGNHNRPAHCDAGGLIMSAAGVTSSYFTRFALPARIGCVPAGSGVGEEAESLAATEIAKIYHRATVGATPQISTHAGLVDPHRQRVIDAGDGTDLDADIAGSRTRLAQRPQRMPPEAPETDDTAVRAEAGDRDVDAHRAFLHFQVASMQLNELRDRQQENDARPTLDLCRTSSSA